MCLLKSSRTLVFSEKTSLPSLTSLRRRESLRRSLPNLLPNLPSLARVPRRRDPSPAREAPPLPLPS